jgi:hypothetical protein
MIWSQQKCYISWLALISVTQVTLPGKSAETVGFEPLSLRLKNETQECNKRRAPQEEKTSYFVLF